MATSESKAGSAEVRALCVPLRLLVRRTRILDRPLAPAEEYNTKIEYIHWNPVKAGLVTRSEEWPWSSVHGETGSVQRPIATPSRLAVDQVFLPADRRIRI
ncbi:MAG TPA: hypothetical protein VMI06_07315 [Terriglobia bacterium]|nr:hypothetical protein [Terriglobia bacterium]